MKWSQLEWSQQGDAYSECGIHDGVGDGEAVPTSESRAEWCGRAKRKKLERNGVEIGIEEVK